MPLGKSRSRRRMFVSAHDKLWAAKAFRPFDGWSVLPLMTWVQIKRSQPC